MDFSINLLESVVLCDSALLATNKTKADLEYKKLTLSRAYDESQVSAALAQVELSSAQSDLASTLSTIEALPPSKVEDDMIKRRMQLELKIFSLTRRVGSNSVLELFEKQAELQLVDHQLEINATLLALINERKMELNSSAA